MRGMQEQFPDTLLVIRGFSGSPSAPKACVDFRDPNFGFQVQASMMTSMAFCGQTETHAPHPLQALLLISGRDIESTTIAD